MKSSKKVDSKAYLKLNWLENKHITDKPKANKVKKRNRKIF